MTTTLDVAALGDKAEQAADMLAALAHAKRLMVMCHLIEGERSVGDLAQAVGLSQSALSQHLARLRALGLVKTRREAQTVFYRLASHEVRAILETLHALYCAPARC